MPKVITGEGLNEFIETGKHEVITADEKTAKTEAKKEEVKVEVKEPEKVEAKAEPDDEEGLTAEEKNETERIRKLIAKKHRAMKQEEALKIKALEDAQDAESFAKNQYERARLAEERAAALEKQLNDAKPKQQAEPELKKPDIKDFTDDKGQVRWTDYTEASADYAAKKAVTEERARQQSEREAQSRAQVEARVKEKLEAAKVKYPDFQEVVGGSELMVPNAVLQYITESDYPADISYHLAKHPEMVERLSKLPPIKAIAEIGKLELTFEKPKAETPPEVKAPERGGAPPPITPIAGGSAGTVNTDPSKMSFQELRAYERTRNKKR